MKERRTIAVREWRSRPPYLLYNRMSGTHTWLEGNRMVCTPG